MFVNIILVELRDPRLTHLLFTKLWLPDVACGGFDTACSVFRLGECKKSLGVDAVPKDETVAFEVSNVVLDSRLNFYVGEVLADLDNFGGHISSVVKDEDLSSRVSEHNRCPAKFSSLVSDFVAKSLAVAFGVETKDVPRMNGEQEIFKMLGPDLLARLVLAISGAMRVFGDEVGAGT